MRFAHPWLLLLLLALPLIAWYRRRRGERAAFLYSATGLVKGITSVTRAPSRVILARLRWLALALLIVGLARPQQGGGRVEVRTSGIDIVVALDLSTSMSSEDFKIAGERVNRLAVAKDVLRDFIRQRSSDRIGLVAFARNAYVVAPPTLDHDFVNEHVDRLALGMVEDGTAIGSGLLAALNRLRDLQSKGKIVILMTDGQNNAGKVPPLTAADTAQAIGVRVYTIGVGTRGTAPMPVTDAFGRKRYRDVEVNIDEDTLREIARQTGGSYFRAESASGLRDIYAQIDKLERTEVAAPKYQYYAELFPLVVLPGWVLLMLELILANTVWRRLP